MSSFFILGAFYVLGVFILYFRGLLHLDVFTFRFQGGFYALGVFIFDIRKREIVRDVSDFLTRGFIIKVGGM